MGFCQCGCGEKTQLAKRTNTKRETKKGYPVSFNGHHRLRGWVQSSEHRKKRIESRYPDRFTDDECRICKDCAKKKGLEEFGKLKRGLQGRRWQCRDCERMARRLPANVLTRKWRMRVLSLLGNPCVSCGIADTRVLAIDHVNGGGSRDKRMGTGAHYQRMLVKEIQAGSTDYRLLCHNCNWIAFLEREK